MAESDPERLMQACGFKSEKRLVDAALTLLEWAVRQVNMGNVVGAYDPAGKEIIELRMTWMKRVHKQSQKELP